MRQTSCRFAALIVGVLAVAEPALADETVVLAARATRTADRGDRDVWRFDVTVAHADTGWEHYADAFDVRTPDGVVLGTRVLLHPHVDEQPFTRSLEGVEIPKTVGAVEIRGRDTVHGMGSTPLLIVLER